MGRVRLQGLMVAGARVAVEVPSGAPWASRPWQAEAESSCSAYEPDVYVGARVGEPRFPVCESVVYASRGRTFEVARVQGDWWIAIRDGHRLDRVACFDADFRQGEVVIHPAAAADLTHPLEHPLDELLAVHCTARTGGLVLRGTAVLRDERALVFAGPTPSGSSQAGGGGAAPRSASRLPAALQAGWTSIAPTDVDGCLALRPSEAGVEVHEMPRVGRGGVSRPLDARLDAIHLIERSAAVFSQRLEADEAAEELLRHVFAPVHDVENAERLATSALRLAARVSVLRLGLPREDRVVPFTWGQRRAALAFAPPYSA